MPQQGARTARLFRNGRNQAVRIPVEFEMPGDSVRITRDGERLIIEPARKPGIRALLEQWRKEPPLGPDDDFPEILDQPVKPEDVL